MRPRAFKPISLLLLLSRVLFAEPAIAALPENREKADDTLVFDGFYRGRFDIHSGINKLTYGDASVDSRGNVRGVSDDVIYMHLFVAGFTYRPSREWELKAYMYDARSWGSSLKPDDFIKNRGTADQYGASYYDDHLELHESYLKKYNFLTKGLALTLGRMNLKYGDSRIIAPGIWGNTIGFLWDGAHLSYKEGKNFADAWYGQTRTREPNDFSIKHKNEYQGAAFYSHYEAENFKIEPFLVWRNTLFHTVIPENDTCYYGMRVYDETPGVIYDATLVKSSGKQEELDIDAYAYAAKLGYQWDNVHKARFTLGTLYASGDRDPNDSKIETFSPAFGAATGPHYGRMDIMIWSNMQDHQAMSSFRPTKDLFVQGAFHHFRLADANDRWYTFNYANQPGNSYTHIGNEYDLTLKYKATRALELTAIGSYLDAGDFITKNGIADNDATKIFFQFLYKFSSR